LNTRDTATTDIPGCTYDSVNLDYYCDVTVLDLWDLSLDIDTMNQLYWYTDDDTTNWGWAFITTESYNRYANSTAADQANFQFDILTGDGSCSCYDSELVDDTYYLDTQCNLYCDDAYVPGTGILYVIAPPNANNTIYYLESNQIVSSVLYNDTGSVSDSSSYSPVGLWNF
ncbi:hypothetical protein HDU76_008554, partial [Blyttiomyces sp. JEL0837]